MSSKVLPEAVWRAFRDEVSTAFVFEVEDKLIEFVKACRAKRPADLTQADKELHFPAGDTFKRQLVRHIAQRFGMATESRGDGFDRAAVVTYTSMADIPETTLRETYAANSSTSTEPTAPTATDTKRTKDETDEKTRLADAITSSFQSLRVSDASYDSRDDKPKPTYDPLRYDRTYDHVIELRNVTPSTTLNDVSTLCARVLSASGGPVTFQDVRRIDDNTVIVVCTNAESAQSLLTLFRDPVIRICPISPAVLREVADDIAPPIRPQTTKAVATRLITSALGGRTGIRRAQEELEDIKQQAQAAKDTPTVVLSTQSGSWRGKGGGVGIDGDWRHARVSTSDSGASVTTTSTTTPTVVPARQVKGRGAVKYDGDVKYRGGYSRK